MPRAGNASGGGQPGWILKCKGWETDPNAYIYFITQAPVWARDLQGDRRGRAGSPTRTTRRRKARLPHLKSIFARDRGMDHDQDQVRGDGHPQQVRHSRAAPILSMKEIAEEPSLRASGTIVEVDHPKRGKYLTVGNPIKMSDSPTEVTRSPLLGEHTDEVLARARLLGRRDGDAARGEDHLTPSVRIHCPASKRETIMSKDKAKVRQLLDAVKASGRDSLTAPEGKLVCDAYGIAVPQRRRRRRAPPRRPSSPSAMGFPVVMKIVSPRHPAQDRGRRRDRRREERRRGDARPTTRSSPTPRSTRPTRRSTASRCSRC